MRTNSVLAPCVLRPKFARCDKKKILPASVLNWTNFKPNRAHWLVGFPILVAFEGIGGVITLGTWGGGVLVSPKFCKFKVLEGIG